MWGVYGWTVTPHWLTYLEKSNVPPFGRWDVGVAGTGGRLYYLSHTDGVSFSTWSQTCGSWNFPKFLFNDGSLTLMYMASLMFLVSPCASLSTTVKHSGLTGCPVVDVFKWMGEGEGALRCS